MKYNRWHIYMHLFGFWNFDKINVKLSLRSWTRIFCFAIIHAPHFFFVFAICVFDLIWFDVCFHFCALYSMHTYESNWIESNWIELDWMCENDNFSTLCVYAWENHTTLYCYFLLLLPPSSLCAQYYKHIYA